MMDDHMIDLVGVPGMPDNAHVCGPQAFKFFMDMMCQPTQTALVDGLNQSFAHVNTRGRLLHFFLDNKLPEWQVQCRDKMAEQALSLVNREG